MGSCCSKSDTLSGGHTLGSGSTMGANNSKPTFESGNGRTVSGGSRVGNVTKPTSESAEAQEERRQRALAAAEERRKAENVRGTNKNNPNSGKLSAQLNKPLRPQAQEGEQPLVWD